HEAPQYNDATYTIYKGKKVVQKDDKDVEVPVYESYTIANRDEQVADYKAYCENVLYYNKYMQLLDRAKTGDVSTDDLKPLLEQGGVIEHMVSEALDPYNHEAKNIILQRANYILEKAYTNRGTVELNDDLSREIKVATQLIFDNMAEVGANVDVQNRIARYAFTSAELAARSNKTATSTQAFNKIMEEINLTGKFSDQTISMLVQDGSLDFLANNSLDQYKEFINVFKDALKIEPGKGLYNLDYYKDTKFEEVVKSIKEIKAVIKK
ncbi:MAG: hypothetical protein WCQ53_06995, partial [bacterium]